MREPDDTRPGLADLRAVMLAWRQQHPHATLTEIETELDRHVRQIRAAVLAETAPSASDDGGTCPQCGTRLVRRGERERTLVTNGDEPVTFSRPYASCPACGSGLFPPG